jgi:CheY-like chemotaxis protein
MLLKITGNEAHTADDGLQALESAEKIRPDVVLLDIGLLMSATWSTGLTM